MAARPIRGSCLCGGVKFEITGKPLWMAHCHCSRCRKTSGTAQLSIRARDFRWVQGEDLVARYQPEPPHRLVRCFCRICGTHLGEPDTNDRGFPIAAHTLDDDPGVRAILHEHVADKPAWYEIHDDLPQHAHDPGGSGDTEGHA